MATNKVQEGEALTVTAPTGGATSGLPVQVVDLIGVAVTTVAAGSPVAVEVCGDWAFAKSGSAGPVFVVGDPVYWTGSVCTTDRSYPRLGAAMSAAGTSDTSVVVRLNTGAARRPFGVLTSAGTQLNSQDTAATAHANTLTIRTGTLRDGDVVRLSALVKVDDNNSSDTLATSLRFGGVTVATQAAHDVADADVIRLEATVSIQTSGASGEIHHFGTGQVQDDAADALAAADVSLDMSGALVVDVTATWGGAHADNKTTIKSLSWEVIR